MKKITFLMFLFVASISYSQVNPIDFETGGHGANWSWTVFENGSNPALEIVQNPDPTGINTSGTVAKFTALQSGQPYAGVESAHGGDIGTFSITSSNSSVTFMVWKSVISDIGIKFATSSGAAEPEIKVANTLVNQWEEITIDFSSRIGGINSTNIDQIIIFPDFDSAGRTQDNIIYIDNITFSSGSGGNNQEPMQAAPTPTEDAVDVISMFSDAYSDVPVDTWNTSWSSATYDEVLIQGNPTKKFTSLDFNGIETTAPSIDAETTGMLYFHMDVWTPNSTELRVKLVDFKGDGFGGANADTEAELTYTPNQEEWVSLKIPLSDFANAGMTDFSDINQLIISSQPIGTSTLFVDNVYFSKDAAVIPCSVPTNGAASNITTESAEVTWTENGTATEWEVMYGVSGFDPLSQGTVLNDMDTQIGQNITDLEPDTVYDVYVRAICGEDDFSNWSEVFSFSTEELSVIVKDFEGFSYYPNPIKDEIHLKANFKIEQVEIYNLLGQKILEQKPKSFEPNVNTEKFPKGVYLMSIKIQGTVKTIKLIKN